MGCILGQGQAINQMPLVGCGQKKKKTQDFLRGAPADPDPGEMGRFRDSRVPGCRRAVSEPHTSARAFAGKPAASAGAGPRGKVRPGASPWLYPCPRPLAGTRIIYDRKFLMECRNSPVTKTPPRDLPTIPGVTSPTGDEPPTEASQNHLRSSPEDKPVGGEWPGSAGLSLQEGEERA